MAGGFAELFSRTDGEGGHVARKRSRRTNAFSERAFHRNSPCLELFVELLPEGQPTSSAYHHGKSPPILTVDRATNKHLESCKKRGNVESYMLEGSTKTIDAQKVFEALFTEYSDAIYRLCLYKTSDKQVAHDLTQDTFLRLWKTIRADKTIEKPKQYIYQIARNLTIDYYKKSKSVSLDTLTEVGFDPQDKQLSAETLSEITLLRETIEALDPDYREVIYMRFVADMGVEDIAETLGISANLVSVRINRGKKKLQGLFS